MPIVAYTLLIFLSCNCFWCIIYLLQIKNCKFVNSHHPEYNNMKLVFSILFCCLGLSSLAGNIHLDSLYRELDVAITRSQEYEQVRRQRISTIKKNLKKAKSLRQQYAVNLLLYEEYRSYINDSAIAYISKCIALAEQLKDHNSRDYCKAALAFQCSTTGMYAESYYFLKDIQPDTANAKVKESYYMAAYHLYSELSFYTKVEKLKQVYNQRAQTYLAQLLRYAHPDSDLYLQQMSMLHYAKGDYKKAMLLNDRQLAKTQKDTRRYAIVSFYRSVIYGGMGNTDLRSYWLAQSAICDVRNAIMDQGSLWELANIIAQRKGSLKRSHAYIRFAWDAAKTFDTRVRTWQIVPVLSAIDKNYQETLDKTNRTQYVFIIAISILSLFLIGLLYYVNRQRNQLAAANVRIKDGINRLRASNHKLGVVNHQLNESNKVKEEYVGRFMRLCSIYIDETESLRRKIAKALKVKDLSVLEAQVKKGNKDFEEFYNMFDSAFLKLFPHFVDDFNALLSPGHRIVLDSQDHLNTTIRIFALIRLGIKDSSKIAEFLHCSVNTIYNYRAQVKNGAIGNRELFEQNVKAIGMPL